MSRAGAWEVTKAVACAALATVIAVGIACAFGAYMAAPTVLQP